MLILGNRVEMDLQMDSSAASGNSKQIASGDGMMNENSNGNNIDSSDFYVPVRQLYISEIPMGVSTKHIPFTN